MNATHDIKHLQFLMAQFFCSNRAPYTEKVADENIYEGIAQKKNSFIITYAGKI